MFSNIFKSNYADSNTLPAKKQMHTKNVHILNMHRRIAQNTVGGLYDEPF